MSERQRYALVTGCGQGGIGEALVHEYKRRGLYAIATLLPQESSEHLDKEKITWFRLDVTKDESILEFKENLLDITGGYLDVLVNNAGICYTMTAIDTNVGSVERMFDVNVFGPMRMVHHFHGMLIKSAGTIVSIGSIGGIVPYVYGSSYNASKAALQHWTNTLRLEMAPFNVKVLMGDQNRELPPDSYFAPLASEFKQHVQRTPKTTNRFVYAGNVVTQSLKASPPAWFWTGSATRIIRFLDTFAFRTVWDYIFWSDFNFGKLQKAHALKEGDKTR
ncbi:hypothetical protein EYC84_009315 [Monilinia fructicola]|uniref:NAD(P)-binding protein n=1 Tax=Monilinia fructicola TaxID=38448 RepID=A0A5M9JE36_MONFR|nr:hypothetical protein EYC84_009315 [Monilinia fructicola]